MTEPGREHTVDMEAEYHSALAAPEATIEVEETHPLRDDPTASARLQGLKRQARRHPDVWRTLPEGTWTATCTDRTDEIEGSH